MTNNKVWIFQSKRFLNDTEIENISTNILNFLSSWASHGADLKSEFKILDRKFIIIEADEEQTKATGCSIDSLNQCIRQIDAEYQLGLLDRLLVSFQIENGEIETLSLHQFKEKIKNAEFKENSWVYNLSVSNSIEFNEKFKQPLRESWAKVYI